MLPHIGRSGLADIGARLVQLAAKVIELQVRDTYCINKVIETIQISTLQIHNTFESNNEKIMRFLVSEKILFPIVFQTLNMDFSDLITTAGDHRHSIPKTR